MKLLVLGAGNMTRALFYPVREFLKDHEVYIYTPSGTRAKSLANEMQQQAIEITDNSELGDFDAVFLGCKPQSLPHVGELLKNKFTTLPKLVISIMAARKFNQINEIFPNVPVMRLMPNMPCLVGFGVMPYVCSPEVPFELREVFVDAFSHSSRLVFVSDEKTFDQLTPVLGSGPGLIYEICKSFEQELIDLSLGEDLSRKLVSELFKGSAELSLGQGKSFAALADEVSSPGGITEKMLETYTEKSMSDGFKAIFQSGRNKGDTL